MYIKVPYRSSSAIQSLEVDALKGLALVKFKNGTEYEYSNVSKLAIINVLFNEDVSLGFWVITNSLTVRRQDYTHQVIVLVLHSHEMLSTRREKNSKS